MAQDSNAIWQELMSSWQNNQQQVAEHMFKSLEKWNTTVSESTGTLSNPILDTYQTIAQSFLKNYSPLASSGLSSNWEEYLNGIPGANDAVDSMKKLLESGENLFESLSKNFAESLEEDDSSQYLIKALMDMSNPNSWLKYSGDNFDISAHKFSEGPLFSGISDLDNRLVQVNESWLELFEESKKYHAIVFSRWTQTYSKFIDELNNIDKEKKAGLSPRKLIDMWSAIANEELLSLHRSDAFLSAQRSVIHASMQYRLHEKKVAEVVCEALHIPTREEIDDLHKTVTELRRELRQIKSQVKEVSTKKKAKQKTSSQQLGSKSPLKEKRR